MKTEPENDKKSVDKKINRQDFLLFTKLMEMITVQGEIVKILMEKTLYGDKE